MGGLQEEMRCILCGGYIPDGTMITVERQHDKSSYQVPREVCLDCASEDRKRVPAQRMTIPECAMEGAFQLAGAIIKNCLRSYKRLYEEAVEELFKEVVPIEGHIGDDTSLGEFLRYHRLLHKRQALNLSLGKMPELAKYTRRKASEGWDKGMKIAARELEAMLEDGK